jgi:hypothetical protein
MRWPGTRPSIVKGPSLAAPDLSGNYWFGDKPQGTAIFRSGKTVRPGKYFISAGCQASGILMDAEGIHYFDSPLEAHLALQTLLLARSPGARP